MKLFFLFIGIILVPTLSAATFIVNNVNDSGAGSLRQALIDNNATPGLNSIQFDIPSGPYRIQPLTDLPTIINPVVIDGYTQPGTSVNTLTQGTDATLLIEINGSNYTEGDGISTGNGLFFYTGSDGSTVRGLVINEWIGVGILNQSSVGNTFIGNFIGTDTSGTQELANSAGIVSEFSQGTIIGTSNNADRNLMDGGFFFTFNGAAVLIVEDIGSTITGNLIGTDRTGRKPLGNMLEGISIQFSQSIFIGGEDFSSRNIISGATGHGIELGVSTGCTISANYIGTDVTGSSPLGNQNAGIYVYGSNANNIVGNIISSNGNGIIIGDIEAIVLNGGDTFENLISNNFIGTDVTGLRKLGNKRNGLLVQESTTTVANNLISSNHENGIFLPGATQAVIIGNYIGTDTNGSTALGNGKNGIQVGISGPGNASNFNVIGGPGLQANLISGNYGDGIKIQSFSTQNTVQNNFIGVDSVGVNPIPNKKYGIEVVCSSGNIFNGNFIEFNRRGNFKIKNCN